MNTQVSDLELADELEPTFIDCGILSETKWPGVVSAAGMIKSGFTSDKVIKKACEDIANYYVNINPNARTRCIDGRHDPELDEKNLGPQVPGGAPGAALAFRLGVDKDDLTRGTFLADAETMIGTFQRLGLPIGGHRDEHSKVKKL